MMSPRPLDFRRFLAGLRRIAWRDGMAGKNLGLRLLASLGRIAVLFLMALLLFGCFGADRVYFLPTRDPHLRPPASLGQVEVETLPSEDGTRLQAWRLPSATRPPRALVLQVHGNAANLGNHIYAVEWMTGLGCEIYAFDYRGYGASEGRVRNRQGPIADTRAALRRARELAEERNLPLVVIGQSIGGNLALAAIAAEGAAGIDAVVVDSTFCSWQKIAADQVGPVVSRLVSNAHSAEETLPGLPADLPVLLVHGTADSVISPRHFHALREALGRDRRFCRCELVANAGHIEPLTQPVGQQRFAELMTQADAHRERRLAGKH